MNNTIAAKELRGHDLMSALKESKKDIKKSRYKKGSIESHLKRISTS